MEKEKCFLNWSGGKDSYMALERILNDEKFQLEFLFTTFSDEHKRVTMHGVPERLMDEQARCLGLPLRKFYLPENCDMPTYEKLMQEQLEQIKSEGIHVSVFGDIFLEDLKSFRDKKLSKVGMKGYYPLWKEDTDILVHSFVEKGSKTIVVAADGSKLNATHVGRVIDRNFLTSLPEDVDPCGENGEFHTFVFDGQLFHKPVAFEIGETVQKTYKVTDSKDAAFWFCELK